MLFLNNDKLRVELIDPSDTADQGYLGTRFAWGGYIWQVYDQDGHPLLSGPEWPNQAPSPFNGQGMPESFVLKLDHAERAAIGTGETPFLGIGSAKVAADHKRVLDKPCEWAVSHSSNIVEFCTSQTSGPLNLMLTRSIELTGNTVTSRSLVTNTDSLPFSLTWFAHPNFPLSNGLIECDLQPGYDIQQNTDFALDANHRISLQRPFIEPSDSHIEWLDISAKSHFKATVTHPRTGRVHIRTDFIPDRCAVWGNSHTWSIEPYLIRKISSGEQLSWSITYGFEG